MNTISYFDNIFSLYLSAILDHFGYGVPKFENWMNKVWYDQKKFEEWFEIQRERRRNKDIMLHMDSDDDSDSHDDDSAPESGSSDITDIPPPPSSSPVDEHDDQGPSSAQVTMGSQPESDIGVERSPDQQVLPSQGPITSIVTHPFRDPKPNADFLTVIDGIRGVLGSFDQKFEFVNWGEIIPINPYAFCSGLTSIDFENKDIHDPRSEDGNVIINTLTRGKFPYSISNMMAKLEDNCYIHGQLPLPSLPRYFATKRFTDGSITPSTNPKRPRLSLKESCTYLSWTGRELSTRGFPSFSPFTRSTWPAITPPSFVNRPEHRPQSPVPKYVADLANSIQETI